MDQMRLPLLRADTQSLLSQPPIPSYTVGIAPTVNRPTFFIMRTVLILLSLAVAITPLQAKSNESPFPLTTTVLATPTSAPSHSPALSTSSDGDVYLSWIEPTHSGGKLLVSQYDQTNQKWSEPHLIATSAALAVSSADTPTITVGRNQSLAAVWLETTKDGTKAIISRSKDGGATWDSPVALTTESNHVAFPTISFWRSGKILAAWLDGRVLADTGATRL